MPIIRFCETPRPKSRGVFQHPDLVKLGEEIARDYRRVLGEAQEWRVYERARVLSRGVWVNPREGNIYLLNA